MSNMLSTYLAVHVYIPELGSCKQPNYNPQGAMSAPLTDEPRVSVALASSKFSPPRFQAAPGQTPVLSSASRHRMETVSIEMA